MSDRLLPATTVHDTIPVRRRPEPPDDRQPPQLLWPSIEFREGIDRFAIVDDGLWHFGSTVGGGHPGLTAASGPWSASDTRAVEFFEECWSVCNA